MLKFGSVCSGIEAASAAWGQLGWQAAWFSEIEPFPSAVLAHHHPSVPNLGDMSVLPERIRSGEIEAPDVFCGGTPCQSFSVAGQRKSLDDDRGNLSLIFCEVANAIDDIRHDRGEQPCVVFWENVPGVLNTKDNAFGCFLAELAGEDEPLQPSGKKWTDAGCVCGPKRAIAWRILDAQYFGLAQRRRRVFVIASAREGFDPAAVLFECEGVRRDSAPSREAGEEIAGTLEASLGRSRGAGTPPGACWWDGGQVSQTLDAVLYKGQTMPEKNRFPAVLQPMKQVVGTMQVRRLTPVECERLQGFPDNHTAIPWRNKPASECPDGPRYKAIGNSWAVPVVAWIGNRIAKHLLLQELGGYMPIKDKGLQRVMYTAECDPNGDGWCQVRDCDPATCDCIGPTEDNVGYVWIDGVLYGKRLGGSDVAA